MRRFAVLVSTLLVLALAVPGELPAFRCGNDLVQKGDRKIEVLKKCGEPASVDEWEEIKNVRTFRFGFGFDNVVKVKVEEWTYNFGPNVFMQIYQFENGEVVDMKFGDYGF